MPEKATSWISFMLILRTNSNKNEGIAKVVIEKDKIMAKKQQINKIYSYGPEFEIWTRNLSIKTELN
jgi:hypothetical protein